MRPHEQIRASRYPSPAAAAGLAGQKQRDAPGGGPVVRRVLTFHVRFHPVKASLFPLAVISVWCCLLRALYHYVAWGSVVWRGRSVKVR